MGIFEGHMAKMADGFQAVRIAEMELAGGLPGGTRRGFLRLLQLEQILATTSGCSARRWSAVGGDGAMYDIGFQNLSRADGSGKPIKVLVVDTQVYSNTGGQACTSGFIGQVSDMAPYGKVAQRASRRRARRSP